MRARRVNLDPATDVPPVLTRPGSIPAPIRRGASPATPGEYYQPARRWQPGLARHRAAGHPPADRAGTTAVAAVSPRGPGGLPGAEGMLLRQEVYAVDGTAAADRPYSVSERNYTIEMLQPALHPAEGPRTSTGSSSPTPARPSRPLRARALPGRRRAAGRPRITPTWCWPSTTTETRCARRRPAYGRRLPDPALSPRTGAPSETAADLYATSTPTRWSCPTAHRTPSRARRHLRDRRAAPAGRAVRLRRAARGLAAIDAELPFQDWDADPARLPAPARRLIGHTRVRYRRDDLSGPLPFGVLEPLALPYRSYRQAYRRLVGDLYGDRVRRTRMLTRPATSATAIPGGCRPAGVLLPG